MIRINLLPHREERRRATRQQFYALAGLVVLAALLIIFFVHGINSARINTQEQKNAFLRREITVLDQEIGDIRRMKEESSALLARKKVIEALQSNRAEAVTLFNDLARLTPEGIYFKSLKQTGNTILLVGYAQSNARVSSLMHNLETSHILEMPSLVEIQAVTVDKRRLSQFTLNVRVANLVNKTLDKGGAPMKWPWRKTADKAAPKIEIKLPSTRTWPRFKWERVNIDALNEQFKDLDMSDVGSWPIAPRIASLLFLLLFLLIMGWSLDWRNQLDELSSKQQQEKTLKQEFLDKKRQSVNLEEYRKQLNEIDRSFGALLKQLPNKEGMETLLIDINQAGLGRGLQFDLFRPGKEVVKDFYAELPIQLRISGNYHDLGQFAGDLSRLSRIVTLGELSLSTGSAGTGLVLDSVATTYRYLETEEIAQLKAQKKGGAK